MSLKRKRTGLRFAVATGGVTSVAAAAGIADSLQQRARIERMKPVVAASFAFVDEQIDEESFRRVINDNRGIPIE